MLVSLLPFVNSMERLRCVSSPKVCLDFFSQFDKLVARIFVLVLLLLQLSQVNKLLQGVFVLQLFKAVLLFVTLQEKWSLGSSFATAFSS